MTKNLRSLLAAETLNWLRGLEFGIPFLRGLIFYHLFFGYILNTNEKLLIEKVVHQNSK